MENTLDCHKIFGLAVVIVDGNAKFASEPCTISHFIGKRRERPPLLLWQGASLPFLVLRCRNVGAMVSGGRNEFLFLFLAVSSFQTPCCFPHDERAFCSSVLMTPSAQATITKEASITPGSGLQ